MTLIVFILLALLPILADLYSRRPGVESLSRATTWSMIYISSAMVFAAYLFLFEGPNRAGLFLSAYTIEKAMSLDNLIIFTTIFAYFGVKPEHEHRVLHWGIAGSAVLRFVFIAAGLVMFFVFGRVLDLAFGAFVCWTAYKMLTGDAGDGEIDHEKRWYIRWTRKIFPVSTQMNGQFFVRDRVGPLNRVPCVTPLLFCLIALEFMDIAFAFDSMPAVIGVTRDPMLVYSAVMFAVIGLRSLYFVLEALKRYTAALGQSVIAILGFVGGKMMVHGIFGYEIPVRWTMGVIVMTLVAGILISERAAAE